MIFLWYLQTFVLVSQYFNKIRVFIQSLSVNFVKILLFGKDQSNVIRLLLFLYFEFFIKFFHSTILLYCVIWCFEILCQPEINVWQVFIHKEIKLIYTGIYVRISFFFIRDIFLSCILFLQCIILSLFYLWCSVYPWNLYLTFDIIQIL